MIIIVEITTVQGLPKNVALPESCTQILAYVSSFLCSTRALTQAEPHLAVAPEQLHLPVIMPTRIQGRIRISAREYSVQ